MDDEVRRWDLLIPASAEKAGEGRGSGAGATAPLRERAHRPDVRALLQRVSRASVTVEGETIASIGPGLLVLLGVGHGTTSRRPTRWRDASPSCGSSRDEDGRTNRSILDVGGAALVVSQFTLSPTRRAAAAPASPTRPPGRSRTASTAASPTSSARAGVADVQTGSFGAEMAVELVNDGPFTVWLDTEPTLASPRSRCGGGSRS